MATVTSNSIVVSSLGFSESPQSKLAQTEVSIRQNSSPPVSSSPANDFSVSISREAQSSSAKARFDGETLNNGSYVAADQKISSSKNVQSDAKSGTTTAEKSNDLVANEKVKTERRNEEEKLLLDKESAKAAELKKLEREKHEKAKIEKQAEKRNALDAVLEATRSSYSNRLLIDAAINGYQVEQSGKAPTVIGGTSEDSNALFIQSNSSQSLSSINLLV